MNHNFFHMLRPVSLTRLTSERLKAIGESLMLLIAWVVIVILTLVWMSLLIRGAGLRQYRGNDMAVMKERRK